MVDGVESLQYKIALFASGMQDGPPSNLSTAERFARLKLYQDAWRSAGTPPTQVLTIPRHIPEFISFRLYGNVLCYLTNAAFNFIRLPSRTRVIEQMRWSLQYADIGYSRDDIYALDPSQNLLVVIQQIAASQ